MSKIPAISLVESKHMKKNVPVLRSGDVVRVHQRIVEAGKERIQIFEGLVISVSGSKGMDASFKVRRIASGVGVERTYPLHSPRIAKIERVKASKVRQAKLYYIRELTGRRARLKTDNIKSEAWEEVLGNTEKDESSDQVEAPQTEDFEETEAADTQDANEAAEESTDEVVTEQPIEDEEKAKE